MPLQAESLRSFEKLGGISLEAWGQSAFEFAHCFSILHVQRDLIFEVRS